jgi:phage-related protein
MAAKPPAELKSLAWVGSAKRDLLALSEEVIDAFGYALYVAQTGKKHEMAKALHGFGSAGILEIVEDWRRSLQDEQPQSEGCASGDGHR